MTVELTVLSRVAYRGKEITGPRLRGLLALLAGEPKGCGAQRLIDGLWPDDQPDNPAKALQILVSRIRAQLGDGLVVRTPTGYRLALDETQIDASAVLQHAAAAAERARTGNHGGALEHAEVGLALWDGPPKPEETRDPLADLRAERAVTYRTLARARALALARLGRHGDAVEPLTDLAAAYPRDEEILLELLRAEAATRGPAVAMARYDTYRRALRDELGADPGPALRRAHQELLQDEQPTVRHGVAHEPNPLLGRDDDLATVADLLHSARVVSVVGPGGLGKTRLAHAVSRRWTRRSVHFVSLAGVAADGDVAAEVASAVGLARGGKAVVPGIVDTLGTGALLVLDNCEHVLAQAADLVATLVAMARDLRILTTSRAPLGLSSESVYPLPELDQPTTVELFHQRARAARPGVDLPDAAVAELCARLDGLPLAVELAAARVRVLPVAEINARLADRFALLRGARRDAPERHHTLHAVVDWSWHLLDADGQAALRALSIFPGGFTVEAADRVLDRDSFDTLEHLVDQSLLKVADTPSGVRFRMLETVREFGAARLAESGDTDRVIDGVLAWARDLAAGHHDAVFGPDPVPVGDRLAAEQDNLLLVLRHGLARGDGASVAAAAAVLAGVWAVNASYIRAGALAEDVAQVLAHYTPAPEHVEVTRTAAALCLVNAIAVQQGGVARMLYALRRLPAGVPDTPVRAAAAVLATPDVFAPDHAALRQLVAGGSPQVAAFAGMVLSYYAEQAGDLPAAIEASRLFRNAWAARTTPWMWILSLSRIGELTLRVERNEESRAYFTEAVRVLDEIGAPRDVVGVYWGMAVSNLQLGELDTAEHWVGRATADNAGTPTDEGPVVEAGAVMFGLVVRGELALARGDVDTGLRLWRQASVALDTVDLQLADPDGLTPWALETQAGAVTAHARFGRLDLVADLLSELPRKLTLLLSNPLRRASVHVLEQQLAGALLVAVGMTDLASGDTASGVRLLALAEHFKFLRGFRPSMSPADVRAAAENADGPVYSAALAEYTGLTRTELRAEALAVLRSRVSAAADPG
ncbi:ATP-binding protein [Actinophytocola sp.]|uniref:ATP-binding protein n=1 Tax=Actinophytocola sp. TaxID=1872138 RepID=UPI002ED58063